MRIKDLGVFRLGGVVLGLAFALGAVPAAAHHEIHEAQKAVEDSLRNTFDAFNKGDQATFADGWTDLAFINKLLFRNDVDRTFPKDEMPIFFRAMQHRGNIEVKKIANIRMLDHMMVMATAEVELVQGNVRELYGLRMVKRMGLDKRYKIAKDELLPLRPEGFPVVDVKMTDFGFEFDQKKLSKNMVLRLANSGDVNHEFIVFKKVAPDNWEDSVARGSWALKPGQASELVLAGLDPGSYVLVCCSTTPPNDEPHCSKGMRTEFTLK